MGRSFGVLLAAGAVAAVAGAADVNLAPNTGGLVLARKTCAGLPRVGGGYQVVAGRNLTFAYELFNVGDVAATDLTIEDAIDASTFDVLGESRGALASLGAAETAVAHTVTVVPKVSGVVDISRATVTYTVDGANKVVVSSTPGPTEVLSAGAALRLTASSALEWLGYAAVFLVPGALYVKSQRA